MRRTILTLLLAVVATVGASAQTLTLDDIYIRDPYIMPVEKEGVYYMYASSPTTENGQTYGGMMAYKSRDLKTWEGPVRVFDVPRDNWITGTVWAPEVHKYKGKYYLFGTLNSDIKWKATQEGHPAFQHRATQIFWSKSPEGPFLPFENKHPHTPLGDMCLDGTLWVEDGVPYMIYCHEWVEMGDGTMELVELKKDLFFLRMQHATNQLDNPVKISLVKKDIARVQTIIRESTHAVEGAEIKITLTFGVVCDSSLEPHELIKKADDNLYYGKTHGKNVVISSIKKS